MRIISANLNGIRAAIKKGFIDWLDETQADVICMQEVRAQSRDITPAMRYPLGLQGYFHCAEKKGYSGVGIYSRRPPDRLIEKLGYPDFDQEGRYIEAQFSNLTVISLYLPSGSSNGLRQQVKFTFMAYFFPHLVQLLQSGRDIIICGDWNIAHQEIDLKNWKSNLNNSGFLPQERAWLSEVFNQGWVDVYRNLYPLEPGYTWWSSRGSAYKNNVGWRIDYHIATPGMAKVATQASIYKTEKFSDHAPLIIDYAYPLPLL